MKQLLVILDRWNYKEKYGNGKPMNLRFLNNWSKRDSITNSPRSVTKSVLFVAY